MNHLLTLMTFHDASDLLSSEEHKKEILQNVQAVLFHTMKVIIAVKQYFSEIT